MYLPDNVRLCLDVLELHGFAAYAVGGCVRDTLLGLTPHDYDLCTSAVPAQTREVFREYPLVLAGEKHGTVGVVIAGEVVEITTFRTEGDYRDSRHPDWVEFVTNIEADLARRDFTVNAMAWSPYRGFADPFGGQADLKSKTLRAVGDPALRFQEDALRILRGMRFAVRYGLTVEDATLNAMFHLAPLMDHLARERVFDELCKLLPLVTAGDLGRFSPILTAVIPELGPTVDFDQRSPHHAYDLFTHTAHVTQNVPASLALRWAALLHDVGKVSVFTLDETGRGHFYGHAKESARIADSILRRLKAPTALRERVVTLIGLHMNKLEPDKKCLRRWLSRYGRETIDHLLLLQEADMGSKGTGKPQEAEHFLRIRELLEQIHAENACLTVRDLAVNGKDLMEQGYTPGPELGACLEKLLNLVLDEQLPNEKTALLDAARFLQGTPPPVSHFPKD